MCQLDIQECVLLLSHVSLLGMIETLHISKMQTWCLVYLLLGIRGFWSFLNISFDLTFYLSHLCLVLKMSSLVFQYLWLCTCQIFFVALLCTFLDLEKYHSCFLDLKYKEEHKFSNDAHLEFFLHKLRKFLAQRIISSTEDNTTHINLNKKKIFFIINNHLEKPVERRNPLNFSYHVLGAYFKLYKAF